MKTQSRHFPQRTRWLPKPLGSGAYRHWLVDSGSLTARLQARCRQFSLRQLRLEWGAPPRDEMWLLSMRRHQRALLREVCLYCDGKPVVFAHSALPRRSLRGPWQGLSKLGNRPLGAALFANPAVARTPLSFRKLRPGHPLYWRATSLLETRPGQLWARRSVFMLGSAALLVTEVFLPEVLQLPR